MSIKRKSLQAALLAASNWFADGIKVKKENGFWIIELI